MNKRAEGADITLKLFAVQIDLAIKNLQALKVAFDEAREFDIPGERDDDYDSVCAKIYELQNRADALRGDVCSKIEAMYSESDRLFEDLIADAVDYHLTRAEIDDYENPGYPLGA